MAYIFLTSSRWFPELMPSQWLVSDPNPNKDPFPAYMYILGFFLNSMVQALLIHRSFYYNVRVALRVRLVYLLVLMRIVLILH